jgi:hypothetical protein
MMDDKKITGLSFDEAIGLLKELFEDIDGHTNKPKEDIAVQLVEIFKHFIEENIVFVSSDDHMVTLNAGHAEIEKIVEVIIEAISQKKKVIERLGVYRTLYINFLETQNMLTQLKSIEKDIEDFEKDWDYRHVLDGEKETIPDPDLQVAKRFLHKKFMDEVYRYFNIIT